MDRSKPEAVSSQTASGILPPGFPAELGASIRTRSFIGEWRHETVPDGMTNLFIVVKIRWIISGP